MAWNPAILVFTQDGKRTHGFRSTDGSYRAKKKKKKKKIQKHHSFQANKWSHQNKKKKKKKNISVTELGNPYTLLKRYESRETYKWCRRERMFQKANACL